MKIRLTEPAEKVLDALPDTIQKRVFKQFDLLVSNIRHPSLRAKNMMRVKMSGKAELTKLIAFIFK